MPELPEVEITKRGIEPWVLDKTMSQAEVRNSSLRWKVPDDLNQKVKSQKIVSLKRRGKYILAELSNQQNLIIHLGMSGSLRVIKNAQAPEKHDHVIFHLQNGVELRFNDPRRFGCILLTNDIQNHALIKNMGPEPLTTEFNGQYLKSLAKNKTQAVKNFIMDGKVVVGVGNIYACESLFAAGIHPKRAASKVSLQKYEQLVEEIKKVLSQAIESGGTTLRDFVNSEGKPGYFAQQLKVYGRKGEDCFNCQSPIAQITLGQRSSFYCKKCQH